MDCAPGQVLAAPNGHSSRRWHWAVPLLLLVMFALELDSVRETSPTYDEYTYIARGYTYLKTGDTRLELRHPILLDALAAAPLLLQPGIRLPLDSAAWASGDFHRYSSEFLWEANGSQALKIVYLARIPIMMLSLLAAAGVFRWALELGGRRAGLVGLLLCACDPNWLAHSRLVTPDAGQTTFIFLSALSWWRFLQRPTALKCAVSGVLLGMAQAAGFPALMLYPVLALVSAVRGPGRDLRALLRSLACFAGASLLSLIVLWGVYGFNWGPVGGSGIPLPAPYHWQELRALLQRLQRLDLAYCCGQVYRGGRWTFFVVAFLIKTPIALLVLSAAGAAALVRRRAWLQAFVLWLLPLLYFVTALASSLNIGYRHILPVLPFLFVTAGQATQFAQRVWRALILPALVAWLVVASFWIRPFYLTYFNEFVGGPSQGHRYLVVSDLDWGQDLPRLARYLAEHSEQTPYLSWFGTMPPDLAGIRYRPLPAWPPMDDPQLLPFHPEYPLPGLYAISAANLVGARLADPATFHWFQDREPLDRIGNSVFVYQVPRLIDPTAPAVQIALDRLALSDIPASVVERLFRTNDMVPRWFDLDSSLILPQGGGWLATETGRDPPAVFQERFLPLEPVETGLTATGKGFQLFALDSDQLFHDYRQARMQTEVLVGDAPTPDLGQAKAVNLPVNLGSVASLVGFEILHAPEPDGGEALILSCWRVDEEPPTALKIFVHLLGPDGSILGQHDGLDVPTKSWHQGDIVIQLHRFSYATAPPGSWLQIGVYEPVTMTRLPVQVGSPPETLGDRVVLWTATQTEKGGPH